MNPMETIVMAWTVCMAVFLGFSFAMLMVTRGDRIEAESGQDPDTVFIVESRERRGIVRVVGWLVLVVVGIYIMLPLDRESTSVVSIAGLFVGPIALGAEDMLEFIDRLRFRRRPKLGEPT